MKKNPPEGMPRITPYLYYADVRAAVAFLEKAFGFENRLVHDVNGDGKHMHAEVTLDGAVVMMGSASAAWGAAPPSTLPALHCGTYVYVDHVDAHCERARAAGATIDAEPEDKPYGDRSYTARDPEGHQWFFAMSIREA